MTMATMHRNSYVAIDKNIDGDRKSHSGDKLNRVQPERMWYNDTEKKERSPVTEICCKYNNKSHRHFVFVNL